MVDIENEKPAPGLEKYTDEFLRDRQSEFEDMRAALVSKDLKRVKELAHKWKGFCGPYGFNHLEVLSESLEKAADELNYDTSTTLVEEISQYLNLKESCLAKV